MALKLRAKIYIPITLGALIPLAIFAGCDSGAKVDGPAPDRQLNAYQDMLLQYAFDVATDIPIKPHLKDRSRAQEAVVTACLELGQPERALGYIKQIRNWRRGAAYADLAFYYARHGYTAQVDKYLALAEGVSELTEDWRRSSIRTKIAKAHALLGNAEKTEEFEAGAEDSEKGKVESVRAKVSDDASFEKALERFDALIASGTFDVMRNALESSTELFNRFYEDAQKRAIVEERIKSSWSSMPIFIRLNLLMDMAAFALEHADNAKALELIDEGQVFLDQFNWNPRDIIGRRAKLARLRFRAGDSETARVEVKKALELFKERRDSIVNIYRAEVLTPLAETYKSMDESLAALEIYKQAVEESVVNPNSRPRAEDISSILISMAVNEAEPDVELWNRINQVKKGLGDPW